MVCTPVEGCFWPEAVMDRATPLAHSGRNTGLVRGFRGISGKQFLKGKIRIVNFETFCLVVSDLVDCNEWPAGVDFPHQWPRR